MSPKVHLVAGEFAEKTSVDIMTLDAPIYFFSGSLTPLGHLFVDHEHPPFVAGRHIPIYFHIPLLQNRAQNDQSFFKNELKNSPDRGWNWTEFQI